MLANDSATILEFNFQLQIRIRCGSDHAPGLYQLPEQEGNRVQGSVMNQIAARQDQAPCDIGPAAEHSGQDTLVADLGLSSDNVFWPYASRYLS